MHMNHHSGTWAPSILPGIMAAGHASRYKTGLRSELNRYRYMGTKGPKLAVRRLVCGAGTKTEDPRALGR